MGCACRERLKIAERNRIEPAFAIAAPAEEQKSLCRHDSNRTRRSRRTYPGVTNWFSKLRIRFGGLIYRPGYFFFFGFNVYDYICVDYNQLYL
ncbi:hypothetical protein [Pelotomaculum sp. FP]|uniref:hypothetical protein n=1 Tax=Pelotomaculum sp. FP TaxID=261474 RepID=UPI00186419CD|nr:hypothetical protein [Pelotomaculum sp. FP]